MKRIFIILAGFCLALIVSVSLVVPLIHQTVWEIPLKVMVGMGRVYVDRINMDIKINGKPFNEGVAFRRISNGNETFVIYFSSKGAPHDYIIVNILPSENIVGITGNTPENGAVLIAERFLLKGDISFGVTPLGFTIKTSMVEPNFRKLADDTFVFDALPDCAGLPAPLPTPDCLVHAKLNKLTRWSPLPFGEWRVKYVDG